MKKIMYILLIIILTGCSSHKSETTAPNTFSTQITTEKNTLISHSNITVSFLGDILTASYIGDCIKEFGVNYPWEDVSQLLNEDDITIGNLEMCVSCNGQTNKSDGYGFRGEPNSLEGLSNAGIDVVSLANNHSLDYGKGAMEDTINNLADYDILSLGAGDNINEAESPLNISINNYSITVLAYNEIIPWDSWCATSETSGTASFSKKSYEHILSNIEQLKDSSDLLFIVLHWGVEYSNIPETWQINVAHKMIDAGADAVIGHHPHVLQGIEIYNNKPILYSIGNFIFHKMNEDTGKTGIFQLVYENDDLKSIKYLPVHINHCKANLLHILSEQGQDNLLLLKKRSSVFETTIEEDGSIIINQKDNHK